MSGPYGPSPIAPPPRSDYKTALFKVPLTEARVREIVRQELDRREGAALDRPVSCAECAEAAARIFGLTVQQVMGKSRNRDSVEGRQVAIWLSDKLTGQGLNEIGRFFDRDHSTIRHSIENVDRRRAKNGDFLGTTDRLLTGSWSAR